MKKNALGRGLEAILKDSSYFTEKGTPNPLREVPIHQIQLNPLQPRKHFDVEALEELSRSIKVHGIIQPLTIRQLTSNTYQLIAGERRLQAAIKAGLTTVPTYIRTANDQQALEMALVENIQRENLNPIEIALCYQRLLSECNIKLEELGNRVGKNRATVNNYLRLLKLPPAVQMALKQQEIDMGHARALINVKTTAAQLAILEKIIHDNLSVRKVEELARPQSSLAQSLLLPQRNEGSNNAELAKLLDLVTTQLTYRLGTPVKIRTYPKGNGAIRIIFDDVAALQTISRILCT